MKAWQWLAVTVAGAVVGYYVTQYLAKKNAGGVDFGVSGNNTGASSWNN